MITKRDVKMIPLSDIDWLGSRQRTEYDNIDDLKKSIAANGLIQSLCVFPRADGRYTLVAGGRRYMALKSLETEGTLEEGGESRKYLKDVIPNKLIPCIIVQEKVTKAELEMLELEENVQRQDMTPMEMANARSKIHDLLKEKNGKEWSMRDTARHLGVSHTLIQEAIKLAKLADIVPGIEKAKTHNDAKKMANRMLDAIEVKATVDAVEERIKAGTVDERKKNLDDLYIVDDWFKFSKKIDDESADLVEVDSPFAINLKNKKKMKDREEDDPLQEYNEWDVGDFLGKTELIVEEAWRILKKNGWLIYWFGPDPWFDPIWKIILKQGFKGQALPAVWVKPGGQTMQTNYYLGHATEYFFYARKGDPKLARAGRTNVFEYKPVPPAKKPHRTTKPIALMEDIYTTFCNPGSRIIIPFLGSGWGLLAADNQKMKAIGCDIGKEFKERYTTKVFNGEPGKYE